MGRVLSGSTVWAATARPLCAAAVGAVALYPLRQTPAIAAAAFIVAYIVAAVLTKATDQYERHIFRRLINWRNARI